MLYEEAKNNYSISRDFLNHPEAGNFLNLEEIREQTFKRLMCIIDACLANFPSCKSRERMNDHRNDSGLFDEVMKSANTDFMEVEGYEKSLSLVWTELRKEESVNPLSFEYFRKMHERCTCDIEGKLISLLTEKLTYFRRRVGSMSHASPALNDIFSRNDTLQQYTNCHRLIDKLLLENDRITSEELEAFHQQCKVFRNIGLNLCAEVGEIYERHPDLESTVPWPHMLNYADCLRELSDRLEQLPKRLGLRIERPARSRGAKVQATANRLASTTLDAPPAASAPLSDADGIRQLKRHVFPEGLHLERLLEKGQVAQVTPLMVLPQAGDPAPGVGRLFEMEIHFEPDEEGQAADPWVVHLHRDGDLPAIDASACVGLPRDQFSAAHVKTARQRRHGSRYEKIMRRFRGEPDYKVHRGPLGDAVLAKLWAAIPSETRSQAPV